MSASVPPPLTDPYAPPPGAPPSEGRAAPAPYARAALWLGIAALVVPCAGPALGVLAVAFGLVARSDARAGHRAGRTGSATAGIVLGAVGILLFAGELGALMWARSRLGSASPPAVPPATAIGTAAPTRAPRPKLGPAPTASGGPVRAPAAPGEMSVPAGPTVTRVGTVTVVDLAPGSGSLRRELAVQRAAADAAGEKIVLETTSPRCRPCLGVAAALSDPAMQRALDHVRLVRVDIQPFDADLDDLGIDHDVIPGFFLLRADFGPADGIHGGEWDDDVAANIAPVLSAFVRGTYARRRMPFGSATRPGAPPARPGGTVL